MAKKKMTSIESYTLKSGEKRYRFQVYIGIDPLTGKELRTTRSKFKTKKDAELALARIKLEIANGTFHKQRAETYQDVYDLWIKQYEQKVEESTFVKTSGMFRNHILPALGSYKIEKMNIDVCQRHVNEWATKIKKARIIKSYAAGVLDFAIKHGYLNDNNPFNLVDVPKPKKQLAAVADNKSENFYTKEQLRHFLKCVEQEDNYKLYAFFHLLAHTGIRKGEAFALTWNDVDFRNKELHITKAIARGKNARLYVKLPKTNDIRTIKLYDENIDVLSKWQKKQKKELLSYGHNSLSSEQLLFSNDSNQFIQPSKTSHWLLKLQNKYDIAKITTHGLRHTHCTLLFEAGATIKEVQDRLGHSDAKTTLNIYAHVSDSAKKGAVLKYGNYLHF
jgi:integrase